MEHYPNGVLLERGMVQPVNTPYMHSHGYHELFFLLSGRRRYFVGHTIYDVAPGDLVIIPRTQLHRTAASGGRDYERYLLNFYEEDHPYFGATLGRETLDTLLHSGCLEFTPPIARKMQRDLERLERELAAPSAYVRPIAAHILQEILLDALCHGRKKEPFRGESANKIQEVARYISSSYAGRITLQEAAQMAYMEKTYFSKRFKELTGFGFWEYLTQTRLRAAEQLLRETRLSVGQVAEECGFCNGNHFGDSFRRWKGVSPTEYRKRCWGETQ